MELPIVYICIPTANLGKYSISYLEDCLTSIHSQSYPRLLIKTIISDHSADNKILNYLRDHGWFVELDIVYTSFEDGRGTEAAAVLNTNNAFGLVPEGSLIKPLFQDDFLKTSSAISTMVDAVISTNAKWVVTGCNHIDENGKDIDYNHLPRWTEGLDLVYGKNTIGSPSVVMFKNCGLRMNEKLCWFNDCEFYYRIADQLGKPALIDQLLISIRMRSDSLTNTLNLNVVKAREHKILDSIYKI